ACSPSGTKGVLVSAATAPEISTERPSGRHNPSSRLTRLTAEPMAVKSSRSAAPILPHKISPTCRAAPNATGGGPGAARSASRCAMPARAAVIARSAASQAAAGTPVTGKIEHAVPDELQHLASEGVHGAGDAIEPGVECCDHDRRLGRFRHRSEAAETRIE